MYVHAVRSQDANESLNQANTSDAVSLLPLRVQAGIHYAYVDQSISLARMATQPPFDSIPLRTLEYWSSTDHWAERRRQAREEIEARVQKAVGDRIVQKRIELLERLEHIEEQIPYECKVGRLRFRSMEGAISALVRLAKFTDDLRDKVLAALPTTGPSAPDRVPTAKLTAEEAKVAVRAILEARRKHGELTGRLESAP